MGGRSDSLLDGLVADLRPVRPVRTRTLVLVTVASWLVAASVVAATAGVREDLVRLRPHAMVIVRMAVLLALGVTSLASVAGRARPGSARRPQPGWLLALGCGLLFPALTVVGSALRGALPMAELEAGTAPWCLLASSAGALLVAAGAIGWLRRCAPTAVVRSAWLTGLGSGALGTLAYSLHCPSESVAYIGIWYALVIGLVAVAGRVFIPRLIRW